MFSPPTMGVSLSHERRRRDLETFGNHMGFHDPLTLPGGLRPDVTLVDVDRPIIFIGDAKHSESPTNRAARARLSSYFTWIASLEAPWDAIIAIGCPLGQALEWEACLAALAGDVGIKAITTWIGTSGHETDLAVLSWRADTRA